LNSSVAQHPPQQPPQHTHTRTHACAHTPLHPQVIYTVPYSLDGVVAALVFALCMHTAASAAAAYVLASSRIPHAMEQVGVGSASVGAVVGGFAVGAGGSADGWGVEECAAINDSPTLHHLSIHNACASEQTLITPFGILAALLWDVFVVDLSNNICESWGSEVDEANHTCRRSNHSLKWAFGLLLIQAAFAFFLHSFASNLTLFSAMAVEER